MSLMKRARDSGHGERAERWMRAWLGPRPKAEPDPGPPAREPIGRERTAAGRAGRDDVSQTYLF